MNLSLTYYVILNRSHKLFECQFPCPKKWTNIHPGLIGDSNTVGKSLVHCKALYLYEVPYLSSTYYYYYIMVNTFKSYSTSLAFKEECIRLKLNHYCMSLFILFYCNYDALILDCNYISSFTYSIK